MIYIVILSSLLSFSLSLSYVIVISALIVVIKIL